MKDLLDTIDLYDDDTPGMADGGRIGFKRGTFIPKILPFFLYYFKIISTHN